MRQGLQVPLPAIHEPVEDEVDLLRACVAERLDVSPSVVSEMIRRLVEVSLVHLDGRTVTPAPAGTEQGTVVLHRHRLAERFLSDVLKTRSGEAVARSSVGLT